MKTEGFHHLETCTMETNVFHHKNCSQQRYVGRVVATRVCTCKCLNCCKFIPKMHPAKHGARHTARAAKRRRASETRHGHIVTKYAIHNNIVIHNSIVQHAIRITVQARCMAAVCESIDQHVKTFQYIGIGNTKSVEDQLQGICRCQRPTCRGWDARQHMRHPRLCGHARFWARPLTVSQCCATFA